MWVGLDWFGQILVDATLATAILLSLVILLMLLWHRVQVARQAGRVALTVDGETIPVGRDSASLTEWLTVEPAADETAILRNLLVTW